MSICFSGTVFIIQMARDDICFEINIRRSSSLNQLSIHYRPSYIIASVITAHTRWISWDLVSREILAADGVSDVSVYFPSPWILQHKSKGRGNRLVSCQRYKPCTLSVLFFFSLYIPYHKPHTHRPRVFGGEQISSWIGQSTK